MRRTFLRLLAIALAVAAGLFLWKVMLARKPVEVTVLEAATGTVEATVTNSRAGTVRARRRAKISPEIGGRAVEIPFREGARVEAGAVLLRLDDQAYQARLTLAERDLSAARAEANRACLAAQRAGREGQRAARLNNEGIVSSDALDAVASQAATSEAGCQASQAGVERARSAIEVARSDLAFTVLRAPFAGVVAEVSIELGEWTTPSPPAMPVPPVIDLIDPSSIYISAPMDEVDSGRVRPDLPARVSVDSHRGQSFVARVTRVAPYVLDAEEQNRTVEIEVELDDDAFAATLLPGTSADVEVILERRDGVLRLPASALLEGDRVLVVANGVIASRQLAIGLRNWDFVEVASGLAAGDLVITSLDRPEVQPGARAIVVAPAAMSPDEAR